MATNTSIEWTEATWNPVRGCSRVSEGCRHCYAERVAARFSGPGQAYEGLAEMRDGKARWTGKLRLVEEHLGDPLKWRKPRRIFVNSMSDLFHESLTYSQIARVFAAMWAADHHTYQILTKRADRMRQWAMMYDEMLRENGRKPLSEWSHVWMGVSVEDADTYKKRAPYLAVTPAAVRFISFEPLLADVGDLMLDGMMEGAYQWAIVGGESGPGARPFELAWARSVVRQCKTAGVPCFVKQMGSCFAVNYYDHEYREEYESHGWDWPEPMEWDTRHGQPPLGSRAHIRLKDRKGGDMSEWPEDLRVRQFPAP